MEKNKTIKNYKIRKDIPIEAVKLNVPDNQIEVAAWLGKLNKEGILGKLSFEFLEGFEDGIMLDFEGQKEVISNGTYFVRMGDLFFYLPHEDVFSSIFKESK